MINTTVIFVYCSNLNSSYNFVMDHELENDITYLESSVFFLFNKINSYSYSKSPPANYERRVYYLNEFISVDTDEEIQKIIEAAINQPMLEYVFYIPVYTTNFKLLGDELKMTKSISNNLSKNYSFNLFNVFVDV